MAPQEGLAEREVRRDHVPVLLIGEFDGSQGCRGRGVRNGEGGQERVNLHSHPLELLLPLSQEVGQAWPRHLVGPFSQHGPGRFHLAN